MAKKFVKMRCAFAWDCPTCKRVNYEEGIPAEFNMEEIRELTKLYGELELSSGNWMVPPEEAKCARCGKTFDATGTSGRMLEE